MTPDIDFKALWQQRKSHMPDEKEVFAKATGLQRHTFMKLSALAIVLLATLAYIINVWLSFDFKMPSTAIGTSLVALAIVIAVLNTFKSLAALKNHLFLKNNKDYLQELLLIKKQQEFTHSTLMSIYFIILSTGLYLYMIEPALEMPLSGAVMAYLLTSGWIAFNWFYIRPKTIRKKQEKLNAVIMELQKIKDAL